MPGCAASFSACYPSSNTHLRFLVLSLKKFCLLQLSRVSSSAVYNWITSSVEDVLLRPHPGVFTCQSGYWITLWVTAQWDSHVGGYWITSPWLLNYTSMAIELHPLAIELHPLAIDLHLRGYWITSPWLLNHSLTYSSVGLTSSWLLNYISVAIEIHLCGYWITPPWLLIYIFVAIELHLLGYWITSPWLLNYISMAIELLSDLQLSGTQLSGTHISVAIELHPMAIELLSDLQLSGTHISVAIELHLCLHCTYVLV